LIHPRRCAVDEMDLEDPMARIARGILFPQQLRIAGLALMRKLSDQMSGGRCTEFPARLCREPHHEIVQFSRALTWRRLVQLLAAPERSANVSDESFILCVEEGRCGRVHRDAPAEAGWNSHPARRSYQCCIRGCPP
jgi:hypothetical protein